MPTLSALCLPTNGRVRPTHERARPIHWILVGVSQVATDALAPVGLGLVLRAPAVHLVDAPSVRPRLPRLLTLGRHVWRRDRPEQEVVVDRHPTRNAGTLAAHKSGKAARSEPEKNFGLP
eukprot:3217016-Pyramimonas_sp.AAC.1